MPDCWDRLAHALNRKFLAQAESLAPPSPDAQTRNILAFDRILARDRREWVKSDVYFTARISRSVILDPNERIQLALQIPPLVVAQVPRLLAERLLDERELGGLKTRKQRLASSRRRRFIGHSQIERQPVDRVAVRHFRSR